MSNKEKLLLFILACVNFTHIVDFMILMPLGPQLMDILDVTPQQFGFLVASYGASAGISGFTLAFFADRFDRKKILLFAYIGFVAGTFACGFSPNFEILLLSRIVAGLFGGMIGSQVLSIIADTFSYNRRAAAMGIIMTAFSLASVVGVPGGLYLANTFGWHAPFFSVGFLGLVVIILIYFFVPSISSHIGKSAQKRMQVITNIIKTPNQLRALLLSTVIMLGHFSIIPYIAPALVANINFKQEDLYLIYLVGGLLTIFSSVIVGKIADKKGKLPVFIFFVFASCIPMFLITNLDLYPPTLVAILVVSGLFFITSNGRLIPTQAMISGVVKPENRGGFMAINSSVQLFAQAIATSIGGAILVEREDGYLENYQYVGYYAIFMVLMSIFIARTLKNTE